MPHPTPAVPGRDNVVPLQPKDALLSSFGWNAVLNFGGNIFLRLAQLIFILGAGRVLGAPSLGAFLQGLALTSLVSAAALWGLEQATLQFMASARGAGEDASRVLRLTGPLVLGLALIASTALAAFAAPIARALFGSAETAPVIRILAFGVLVVNATELALAVTRAERDMLPTFVASQTTAPLVRLLGLGVVIAVGAGASGLALAHLASLVAGLLVAAPWATRKVGRLRGETAEAPRPREVLAYSLVQGGQRFVSLNLLWLDSILIGSFLNTQDVGQYGVASRVALAAGVLVTSFGLVLAPYVAYLWGADRLEELGLLYRTSTRWIVAIAAPAFLLIGAAAKPFLALVGRDFKGAVTPLAILAVAGLFDAMVGPAGLILSMTRRNKLLLINNGAVLALNIGLNLYLIPRHGIVGAAISWAIAILLVNVARVAEVWVLFRIHPFEPRALLRVAALSVPALAILLLVERAADSAPAPSLLVGGVLFLGAAVGGLVWGAGEADREVWRSLRARAFERRRRRA